MNIENKSYANICWKWWFVLGIVFFLGKNFKIYLLKDIPFGAFFFFVFMILIVIYGVAGWRMSNYLQKNHSEKLLSLSKGFQGIKFFFSKEAFNDPILSELKNEAKKIFLLCMVHFFSAPFFFVGLNILNVTGINAKFKSLFM